MKTIEQHQETIRAFGAKVAQLAEEMGIELYDYGQGTRMTVSPPLLWYTISFREQLDSLNKPEAA